MIGIDPTASFAVKVVWMNQWSKGHTNIRKIANITRMNQLSEGHRRETTAAISSQWMARIARHKKWVWQRMAWHELEQKWTCLSQNNVVASVINQSRNGLQSVEQKRTCPSRCSPVDTRIAAWSKHWFSVTRHCHGRPVQLPFNPTVLETHDKHFCVKQF